MIPVILIQSTTQVSLSHTGAVFARIHNPYNGSSNNLEPPAYLPRYLLITRLSRPQYPQSTAHTHGDSLQTSIIMDKVKDAVKKATSSSDSVRHPMSPPLSLLKAPHQCNDHSCYANRQFADMMRQEKQFTTQPIEHGFDPKMAPHQAHPGPALAKEMPQHEGSKEERQARKEELNK